MMTDLRGMLALICAVVAVGLLLIVLSRSASRRTSSGRLLWIYVGLFALVSLVLWRRGDREVPPVITERAPAESGASSQPPVQPPQDTVGGTKSPTTNPSPPANIASTPASVPQSQVDAPPTSSARSAELPASLTEADHQNASPPRPSSKPRPAGPPLEDRIESAIVSAFDFVDRFFEKYAWTASQSVPASPPRETARREAQRRGVGPLEFPAVSFYTGSAELTGESQSALKVLAEELAARPNLGILEIQARIDSVGPEAFNYILTQARAAVVRDFLVGEGVPSTRLVARGLGSEAEACGKDLSPIEFVVRR